MLRIFLHYSSLLIVCCLAISHSAATTIGIHNIQGLGPDAILQRENTYQKTIPIIGMIFDKYEQEERDYLTHVVSSMGTGRIYHISLSPFGYTAKEVKQGYYDKEYENFFEDIKRLNIRVIFRTMHEMNGGRYSRSSQPVDFQVAWRHVRKMARQKYKLPSDKLLFSLSFNSQDLPTTDARPTQESPIRFCSQRQIDQHGRCPRKADYYPGGRYVDLIGVTLYNRGRSRPDTRSKWKTPRELRAEDDLGETLLQRNKPIIIDELGTTAINFTGVRTTQNVQQSFVSNTKDKNAWLAGWKSMLEDYPMIKAIVYFNVDMTAGATKQVTGQAEWSIILSPYRDDYEQGIKLLTEQNNVRSIERLFRVRK